MTERDNFILRWARLKRTSDTGHKIDPSGDKPPGSAEAGVAGAEATVAQPGIDVAADEPLDLASLPSIEAITANTDVRGFLQSRVPAELTRTALRRAWTRDPAIRDFIGIADNQWDFNDPNAIPGFGPLPAADGMPAVLAQPPGRRDEPAEMILEMPASAEQSLQAATGHERADLDQREQQTFNGSPSTDDGFRGLPDDGNGEDKATKNNRVAEGDGSPRKHRSHGSALPR
jgi:hypothetical protein